MSLSETEIAQLLKLLRRTEDRELNCEQCLALVAEFAESHLAGKSIPAGLQAIEQHLAVCGECLEEYEALRLTLDGLRGGRDA
ncbi:hypothetical protein Pla108_41320 [Botrimarina colliarenosi]|uniref:Zinc-finger domain-containing protein n=1 Tax=Botrimarina colliarenosi TaxID=2528001 RepID=A0A5C5ZWX3_9BACT|nr:hypothetical protein [Botrimarina colliarenosi]TWT92122.1 hypothetical protein Pla108_41320 [Botrimarina colliarenosi]